MEIDLTLSSIPNSLGRERAEAISAIEGQYLSPEQRKRAAEYENKTLTPNERRAAIFAHYSSQAKQD